MLFGVWFSDAVSYSELLGNIALSLGNIAGGLLLITLTHSAQVKPAEAPRRSWTLRGGFALYGSS